MVLARKLGEFERDAAVTELTAEEHRALVVAVLEAAREPSGAMKRSMTIHTGSIGRFVAEVDARVSPHLTTPRDATELKFLGIRVVEDDQVLPHIAVLKHGDEVVAVVNFDA